MSEMYVSVLVPVLTIFQKDAAFVLEEKKIRKFHGEE
jgi:hypothetical protein